MRRVDHPFRARNIVYLSHSGATTGVRRDIAVAVDDQDKELGTSVAQEPNRKLFPGGDRNIRDRTGDLDAEHRRLLHSVFARYLRD